MATIATSDNAFPETKINLNGNLITVSLGSSLSVYAGMANAVYFGTKTQLVAGVNTNITLGHTTTCTFGNILGSTYGNCWAWTAANNTTFDIATRWASTQNIFAGGVSDLSYSTRKSEQEQGQLITMTVLASYIASIGLTLYGMLYPPFTMVDENEDGYADNVTANWIEFTADGGMIMVLGLALWYQAQVFSAWKNFDPVSYMDYTAAGMKCEVYQFPDTMPSLTDALTPAPPITATQNAKAGFYLRPYLGIVQPAIPPLNRNPVAHLPASPLLQPEIELLTTSTLPPYGHIFMTPGLINIGVGSVNTPDISGMPPQGATRAFSAAPAISFEASDPMKSSITFKNDLTNANTITMDLSQTTIKRLAGTVSISTGAPGTEIKLALDTITGAELATPMGSVAIDAAGITSIKATIAGTLVASFSSITGVKLTSGTNSMEITAAGARYSATVIQI